MSGSLNKVMLIGHLGDDIKMHYFEGGGAIGRFPLATNETYTKKIIEQVESIYLLETGKLLTHYLVSIEDGAHFV